MSEPDAPPLHCPRCGKPLIRMIPGTSGVRVNYRCIEHGGFWIDDDGQLCEERREPGGPRRVG